MAGTAVVGTLRALLTLDTAQFEKASVRASKEADKLAKGWSTIGRQAKELGQTLTTRLTLPLVAMAGAAAKAAMDFESSFAGVRKTVTATEPQFKALEQGFRNLAKEIPISVNELNKVGEAAGQLGIETSNILGFSEVMAKLGVTTNLSSDQAATSLARLANITQMNQGDFDRLGSTIVALGNNFATTEQEIVEFGLRIAGAGAAVGMTEPQILAVGTALSSLGVEAEAGGTAVQKVLLTMLKSVQQGGQALEQFARTAGMSAAEFKAAFKEDAGAAFAAFVDGLGRAGDNAINVLDGIGLADQRLIRSFLALAGSGDLLTRTINTGNDAWRDNNALTKEAQERFKTVASQLQLLWNKVNDLGISLGQILLPHIIKLVDKGGEFLPVLEHMVQGFAALPEPVQQTALALGALVAAAGPALWFFGSLTSAAGTLAKAVGAKGLLTKLGGWSTLGTVFRTVGTALTRLMGPVGWLIGAAAGVVTATNSWDELGRIFKAFAGIIQNFVLQVFDQFVNATQTLWDLLKRFGAWLSSFTVIQWLGDKLSWLGGKFEDLLGGIASGLETLERITSRNPTPRAANAGSDIRMPLGRDIALPGPSSAKPQADGPPPPVLVDPEALKAEQKALQDHLDHVREQRRKANKEYEDAALEQLNRAKDAYEAMTTVDRQFADERAKNTLSELEYELFAIDQWLTAEKEKYHGALNEAAIYAKLEEQAREKRNKAVLKDNQAQLDARNKQALDALKKTNDAQKILWNEQNRVVTSAYNAQVLEIHRWAREQKAAFVGTEAEVRRFYEVIDQITQAKIKNISETWSEFFRNGIPQTILAAIQGGGDAIKALGTSIGTKLGDSLSRALGDKVDKNGNLISGFLSKTLGKTVGNAIVSMLPGIGALLGSLAGKLASLFAGLFTGGEGAKANDLRDSLKKQLMDAIRGLENDPQIRAGLDAFNTSGTRKGVQAAFDATMAAIERTKESMQKYGLTVEDLGTESERFSRRTQTLITDLYNLRSAGFSVEQITAGMAEELNNLIATSIETGQQIPIAFAPLLEQLVLSGQLSDELAAKLLGVASPVPWQEMEAAAEKYGISIDALGKKFEQAKLDDSARELADDWQLLVDGGADVNGVIAGMTDEVQDLITKALQLGLTIPESMRPVVEAMAEAGELTDENGDKLEDLSRIEWAPDVLSDFDQLILKIDELIDKITQGLYPAIDGIPSPSVGVPDYGGGSGGSTDNAGGNPQYDSEGNPRPQFDEGGWGRFGGGRTVDLHGTEAVFPLPHGFDLARHLTSIGDLSKSMGGGEATFVFDMDGRTVARMQAPYIVDEVRRLQLAW